MRGGGLRSLESSSAYPFVSPSSSAPVVRSGEVGLEEVVRERGDCLIEISEQFPKPDEAEITERDVGIPLPYPADISEAEEG